MAAPKRFAHLASVALAASPVLAACERAKGPRADATPTPTPTPTPTSTPTSTSTSTSTPPSTPPDSPRTPSTACRPLRGPIELPLRGPASLALHGETRHAVLDDDGRARVVSFPVGPVAPASAAPPRELVARRAPASL